MEHQQALRGAAGKEKGGGAINLYGDISGEGKTGYVREKGTREGCRGEILMKLDPGRAVLCNSPYRLVN